MPDFRQLQRFIAVAEHLSFRRAAERLHLSQPPLSDSIRQLEEEIGTPLLRRTRRSVELTPQGELFLERARLVLSQLEEAVGAARAVAQGMSGRLAIGFFPSATYDLLPRILRRFRERHPGILLKLVELTTPEQADALLRKRIDIGLFLVPVASARGIAHSVFMREPLVVVLPEEHRLARRRAIALTQLRDEPFIFIPPRWGTGYHARVSQACQEVGFMPRVIEEVEHLHTMVSLVAAGMGVALGAASLARFQPPGAVFRKLADASALLHIEFGMAWREQDPTPGVAGFLDIAREIGARKMRKRLAR